VSEERGKSVPLPDLVSSGFWEGTAARELRVQTCRTCGQLQFYPRALCTVCASMDLGWVVSPGLGVVYSFTVVRRHQSPWWAKELPYVVVIIELDEGTRMLSNLVDCDPAKVRIGMRVRVSFRQTAVAGIVLPLFTPAVPD
jgi:uncharacterized protein